MPHCGTLYIVGTPIGHKDDITLRALNILKKVDIIACEDTRVTHQLLTHHAITGKQLIAYHDHSNEKTRDSILSFLRDGKDVALVSDAGTPLISDPGYKLVHAAHEEYLPVAPIPGASSVMAALSSAGLPTHRFLFEGFLPQKSEARKTQIRTLKSIEATLVFFESPRRLLATLEDMQEVVGDRIAAVARELTKTYEEIKQGPLSELISYFSQESHTPRGEIVLLLSPPEKTKHPEWEGDLDALLLALLDKLRVKDAASVASTITGISKNELYNHALTLKET